MKKLFVLLLFLASVAEAQIPTLTLDWTAPGDDGAIGTASAYEGRFATTKPDTLNFSPWWTTATPITGLPVPLVAGTTQSVNVSPAGGYIAGNTYYFVLRTRDEAGNWSTFSNVAFRAVQDVTAPRGMVDLRVR